MNDRRKVERDPQLQQMRRCDRAPPTEVDMSTPASFKGHPIHPMLVPLAIGLWIFALVADVMTRVGGAPAWRTVAFYAIGGGVVGALLAAVPGLIDLFSMSAGPTKRIGLWHMSVNLLAVALFATAFVMRLRTSGHSGSILVHGVGRGIDLDVGMAGRRDGLRGRRGRDGKRGEFADGPTRGLRRGLLEVANASTRPGASESACAARRAALPVAAVEGRGAAHPSPARARGSGRPRPARSAARPLSVPRAALGP